jgi:signal transduction histidine kinase
MKFTDRFSQLRPPPSLPEALEAKAQWLVNLRWVAIAAQVLCIAPGLSFNLLTANDLVGFALVTGFLMFFNLLFPLVMERRAAANDNILLTHLIIDLIAFTALLWLSRGVNNPFVALFYLHAALGSLLLSGLRNLFFLFVTCGAFIAVHLWASPMRAGSGVALSPYGMLGGQLIVILLIWQLTRWLAAQLAHLESNLRLLEQEKSEIDNLRALGAMAASFFHKFATPLNTIKLRIERMSRPSHDGDLTDELASARSALAQCEGALRSMVHAVPTSPDSTIDTIELKQFIENICNHWQLGHRGIDFHFVAGEETVYCRIPGLVLTRTIIDLLDNAFQASLPVPASIEVSVHANHAEALIEIADRGCGMTSALKARIGEPFISTRALGAGLGLFTAQTVAKAFAGDLRARDREGGGTVVALILPLYFGEELDETR